MSPTLFHLSYVADVRTRRCESSGAIRAAWRTDFYSCSPQVMSTRTQKKYKRLAAVSSQKERSDWESNPDYKNDSRGSQNLVY